ncbi:hypothetical protein ACP4OV_023336 [Aristida adscensionis]
MSVAVCRAMAVEVAPNSIWMMSMPAAAIPTPATSAIDADAQDQKEVARPKPLPLAVTKMSPASLQLCTETLGCETGSDDTTPPSLTFLRRPATAAAGSDDRQQEQELGNGVRYQWSRPRRAFPPPLPSLSRRDGACVQLRRHRRDGRLVLEAVPARPRAYLHAQRQGGRLRLCFVHYSAAASCSSGEEEEEEEEEVVEVVDRGSVVEVKAAHRPRLVINKFVAGTPPLLLILSANRAAGMPFTSTTMTTTTLAAAVAAAAAASTMAGMAEGPGQEEEEVESTATTALFLFTSRSRELGHSVRCRQLRPLFILEPYGTTIATS